jgi:hypothetical protein
MEREEFQRGYITGVAVTYCEAIRTGTKLVAEIGCNSAFKSLIEQTVKTEGGRVRFVDWGNGEITAWIFEDDMADFLAEQVMQRGDGASPTPLSIWATGKLFGYSDNRIMEYLETLGYSRHSTK